MSSAQTQTGPDSEMSEPAISVEMKKRPTKYTAPASSGNTIENVCGYARISRRAPIQIELREDLLRPGAESHGKGTTPRQALLWGPDAYAKDLASQAKGKKKLARIMKPAQETVANPVRGSFAANCGGSVRLNGAWHSAPERDNQRAKVYAAEKVLDTLPRACRRHETVEACRQRVSTILSSRCVTKLRDDFGQHPIGLVRVGDGRGRSSAASFGGEIRLPKWARKEWVILHELAHEVAPRRVRHGWPFAFTYLKLVSRFLGKDAHDALRASFKKHRVRYRPKRSVVAQRGGV